MTRLRATCAVLAAAGLCLVAGCGGTPKRPHPLSLAQLKAQLLRRWPQRILSDTQHLRCGYSGPPMHFDAICIGTNAHGAITEELLIVLDRTGHTVTEVGLAPT